MKITFSLNQVAQIQIATLRRSEVYDLVRSYHGYEQGTYFGDKELLISLESDFLMFLNEYGEKCFSIRGTEVGLETALHSIKTLMAIEDIQHKLNGLVDYTSSIYDVRKAVKNAKDMIDAVEW